MIMVVVVVVEVMVVVVVVGRARTSFIFSPFVSFSWPPASRAA
jgi:hypothetical protein